MVKMVPMLSVGYRYESSVDGVESSVFGRGELVIPGYTKTLSNSDIQAVLAGPKGPLQEYTSYTVVSASIYYITVECFKYVFGDIGNVDAAVERPDTTEQADFERREYGYPFEAK
jgi:hypothetical protein